MKVLTAAGRAEKKLAEWNGGGENGAGVGMSVVLILSPQGVLKSVYFEVQLWTGLSARVNVSYGYRL